jgi:small GTP-binding protein
MQPTMNLELPQDTRELLNRERLALADLRTLLGRLDAEPSDLDELKTALRNLEDIFLLVVCGEYNSGKSTLINALLGAEVMPRGVTPTTDRITTLTYGEKPRDLEETSHVLRREYPAPILRDLALVDTPGTNAVIKKHQELTERFIPRADLVLFVTSADRPFTETERGFLELIGSWGKKIVLVVNKMDLPEDGAERQQVLDFVREHARATLGLTPQVFGVKARQAFRAQQAGDQQARTESGLPALEASITTTLTGGERLKLKLQNPLGVARRIAENYEGVVTGRLALLSDDRRTLEEVDRQLGQYERDMRREFSSYLDRIKTVLLEVERRGDLFFDDLVRLRHILELVNRERVQDAFEARVIRGADKDIDKAVSEMVDWFIHKNLHIWEDVMRFVQERHKAGKERVIGDIGGRFQYDRETLLRNVSESAESVMTTYDSEDEGRRLAMNLQSGVVQTGLIQASGIGLGALMVALISSAALDVTGILAGLTLVGVGFFVLPQRRAAAKRQLHQQMQSLRDKLSGNLGKQFDGELHRALGKLSSAISPYTRFVRSELERLETLQNELAEMDTSLRQLKLDTEAIA